MSRRKQAKPRAFKREDGWDSEEEKHAEALGETSPLADCDNVSSVNGDDADVDAEEPPPSRYDVTLEGIQMALMDRRVNLQCLTDAFLGDCDESGGASRRRSPTPHVTPDDAENSLESVALGTDPGSSWRSETPEDQTSPSPSSCATPNSATDVPDAELTFTVGVTEATPYACQFCDKAFPRLSYLKKHEQTHSDQMPFRCEFCSRLFKHKRSRDRHIKLHTGDKKYRCSHCEAAFSRSDHLKIHMKTHDNQKPFQCTVCNRGYNTAAALTSHMQNHKKEQQNGLNNSGSSQGGSNTPSPGANTFRCLQCGDTFRKPEDLQAHMTSHQLDASGSPRGLLGGLMMGDLPPLMRSPLAFPPPKMACIYCTKDSFNTMEALQLHVQAMHGSILNGDLRDFPSLRHHSHPPSPSPTSSPPYSCELCTMRFSSAQAMQKHALGVHGLLAPPRSSASSPGLFCIQCSVSFPSATLFADHYVLMHGHLNGVSLMNSSPPIPEQTKPTDLSKKSRSSKHVEERVAKRQKTSDAVPMSSADSTTSLMNQYDHPGTLLCNQCSAALPDFESFRNHLKAHLEEAGGIRGLLGGGMDLIGLLGSPEARPKSPVTSSNILSCPHCGAKFDDQPVFEQHVASHFMATATEYGCQSCLKLFAKPDELQKHLMDIHAHHLYRCSLCKEMFDSKVAIQVHFAVKHSNECKMFRCTACANSNAVYRTEVEFATHVRNTHALPLPSGKNHQPQHRCLFCHLSFATELEMQFHLAAHAKQYHCHLCQEAFHVEFLLDKHMQTHHEQKSPKTNGTPTSSSNTPVSNNHSEGKKEPTGSCDICDRCDFASESELQSHRKLVHHVKPSAGKNGAVSLHCAYCSENCKSRTELENHMKTHSQGSGASGKHKCNICDELCPSAAVLAEHKLTHCKVVSGSACTQCKASLNNEDQFYSHLQQHSNNNNNNGSNQQVLLPTPCVVCRQTLISDIEVRMHARFHLKNSSMSDALFQCCLCLKQFEFHNVIMAGGGNGITPNLQSATYVCKDCYHLHRKPSPAHHHVSEDHRCPECQVKFETSSALEKHLVSVHRKTYQCIKCQVSFETEREIQLHVATHMLTDGSSHECHLCRRHLATPLKLQAHLIEHTFAGCGSFTCYLCSAVFTAAQGLQHHMLEHGLSARPYDCTRCSLRFFFRAELDNHSFTHLDEDAASVMAASYHHLNNNGAYDMEGLHYYKSEAAKKAKSNGKSPMFKCLECNKELSSALGLQAHQRYHKHATKDKKTHACVECGKEFALARNLSVHMRSHHEEVSEDDVMNGNRLGLVYCPVCRQDFPEVDQLDAHITAQHVRCPQCGEPFSHQEYVNEHVRAHHEVKQEVGEVKEERVDEEEIDVSSPANDRDESLHDEASQE